MPLFPPGPPLPMIPGRPADAGSFAESLYDELEPLTWDDESQDWSLLKFFGALGQMYQQIENYARDTDEGPGWSVLMDVDRCPDEALPWLGQFVGADVRFGLTPTQQRDRIKHVEGWSRGTPGAIRAAAQRYLTGNKTVIMREREGGAWRLTVGTYTAETPNVAAVLAVLNSPTVKPVGIIINYVTTTGQDYANIYLTRATYAAVFAAYATYQGVLNNVPGT